IAPLVGAIAAGNCAVIKPSEFAPATSRYLKGLIQAVFNEYEVAVVEGDGALAQALIKLKFDHIFFTGSTRVGKMIMTAAASNLASVTLELGGKSPAFVFSSANITNAAEKIVWGKFINAGQTCIAPDYVMVEAKVFNEFIRACRDAVARFYPGGDDARINNSDYCKIVNLSHFTRLKSIFAESLSAGANVELGGEFDTEKLKISPTIMSEVSPDSLLMGEEIFGPILPVIKFQNADESYQLARSHGKPLASYIFSKDKKQIREFITKLPAGGTCINTTVLQIANPWLPFGGVGESGMGHYHGIFGFKAFSHERGVVTQGRFSILAFVVPPYSNKVKTLVKWFLKFLSF
ncbi:MAG: aldehyde dehydrogenase family protein, partial [Candidatus Paceibacterales bacterium]